MPIGNPKLRLGDRHYDLTRRCLVMGMLDHTAGSYSDQGATSVLDRTLQRADGLVAAGADILDVGAVGDEELDRVVPAIAALAARFDVALSAGTGSPRVLAAACDAGAVVGHDVGGFGDAAYLPTAARHGATVIATHVAPAAGGDLVAGVAAFLADRAEQARAAGLGPDQIVVDAGLDVGKTAAERAVLLRESGRLAGLGYPLLLSPSGRRAASLAAVAYGVAHGCRIVRVHDVAGTVRVVRAIEQILGAGGEPEAGGGR